MTNKALIPAVETNITMPSGALISVKPRLSGVGAAKAGQFRVTSSNSNAKARIITGLALTQARANQDLGED